eukprot:180272-Alexandrium_andersonii.AAC.1
MGCPATQVAPLRSPLALPTGPRRGLVGPTVGPLKGATSLAGHPFEQFEKNVELEGLAAGAREASEMEPEAGI